LVSPVSNDENVPLRLCHLRALAQFVTLLGHKFTIATQFPIAVPQGVVLGLQISHVGSAFSTIHTRTVPCYRRSSKEVSMRTLLVSLILLGARVAAGADVLATAPFLSPVSFLQTLVGGALICNVVNVSATRTVTVSISSHASDNNDDLTEVQTVTLPPFNAAIGVFEGVSCIFEVTNGGSKKDIRAVGAFVNLLGMGEVDFTLPAQ
jgi:hypothetical protein